MIVVVKCYKYNVKPLVIEVFEGHVDLSYVAVINDSKIETNE